MTELYDPLEDYVKQNFNGLVKIFVQKERRGLVVGRLEGARIAKGEVLVGVLAFYYSVRLICVVIRKVFLDAQVEVNVNWLPPLLGKNESGSF